MSTSTPDQKPAPAPDHDPLAAVEDRAFSVQILQFFLFPLLLVITCLAIFVLFGLASREPDLERLMSNLARGGEHSRNVAAYQLSKMLGEDAARQRAGEPTKFLADSTIPDALLSILADEDETDDSFLSFIALAGAYTRDERFVDPIVERLSAYYQDNPPDQAEDLDPMAIEKDPEVTYYLALGEIADPDTVAAIRPWLTDGDVDTRKLAVVTIGAIDTAESSDALRAALDDLDASVRANAALQLAARRDEAAIPMLRRMLDPAYVSEVPGITEEQRRIWLMQASAGAATIGSKELEQALDDLANNNGDPRVVNAARESLDRLRNGGGATSPTTP